MAHYIASTFRRRITDETVEIIVMVTQGRAEVVYLMAMNDRGEPQEWRATSSWFDGLHTWARLRRTFSH